MERKIYSVFQINRYIKVLMEEDYILSSMWIRGEISNLKKHSSGHIYFTLKDEASSIDCVMFRDYASLMPYEIYNGQTAVVCGYISVYEKTGSYKLYAQIVDVEGKGDLNAAFEELKRRLSEEGLFDEDYKREIEKRPKCVAVVTSPTGAAIRDIIQIAGRRNGNVKIIVCPCLVQGEAAAESIVKAIEEVNKWGKADTIIVGRGGGSMEDLWCFNDERVARAIFASEIPVISAVGHEIDFTIADFAADMRAPTPSAAAELAINSLEDDFEEVLAAKTRLIRAYKGYILRKRLKFNLVCEKSRLLKADRLLEERKKELEERKNVLEAAFMNGFKEKKNRFERSLNTLEALSPLSILKRGYSIAYCGERIIKSCGDVKKDDEISIRLADGAVNAVVKGN